MLISEQKEMCDALQKIIKIATKTFNELRDAFALLAQKQEEKDADW